MTISGLPLGSSIGEIKRIETMRAILDVGIEWTVNTQILAGSDAEWLRAVRRTGSKFIDIFDIVRTAGASPSLALPGQGDAPR